MAGDVDNLIAQITELVFAKMGNAPEEHCGCTPHTLACALDAGASRLGLAYGQAASVNAEVAKYIDHTLLKPEATRAEVDKLCHEARTFGFASVCVNPTWVRESAILLHGSPVAVCTVVGFPLGATLPDVKAYEARRAILDGASEIDMVINIGALKSGLDDIVFRDILAVVEASHDACAIVKTIIETALLTDDEKARAELHAAQAL